MTCSNYSVFLKTGQVRCHCFFNLIVLYLLKAISIRIVSQTSNNYIPFLFGNTLTMLFFQLICSTGEYFALLETSPLTMKGCKIPAFFRDYGLLVGRDLNRATPTRKRVSVSPSYRSEGPSLSPLLHLVTFYNKQWGMRTFHNPDPYGLFNSLKRVLTKKKRWQISTHAHLEASSIKRWLI